MFKKTTLALLTASLFISTSALAISNNTITFRGEVSDETCSVAINGNQAKPVVILPTVSAKELAKGGDVAGQVTLILVSPAARVIPIERPKSLPSSLVTR